MQLTIRMPDDQMSIIEDIAKKMGLKKEAYKSIESIVGIENISDEPAVMDSYTWQYTGELTPGAEEKFMKHRPAAVVLPGNTNEV